MNIKTILVRLGLYLIIFFFSSCGNSLQYEVGKPHIKEGWFVKEPTGTQWSKGETSMIILYEDKLSNRERNLTLEGQYFHPQRFSQLLLNNELVGEVKFDKNKKAQFNLQLKNNLQPDTLLFKHYDIKSPFDLGISADKRKLKLSINTITLQ